MSVRNNTHPHTVNELVGDSSQLFILSKYSFVCTFCVNAVSTNMFIIFTGGRQISILTKYRRLGITEIQITIKIYQIIGRKLEPRVCIVEHLLEDSFVVTGLFHFSNVHHLIVLGHIESEEL